MSNSNFSADCLRSINHLQTLEQCITSRFQNQHFQTKHAALLFVHRYGTSLTTFKTNLKGEKRSSSPSLQLRRESIYGCSSSISSNRVGISFDQSSLAHECFQSGEITIANGSFLGNVPKGSRSLANFLTGTQAVENVVFVPLRDLNNASETEPAVIGILVLYDRIDGEIFTSTMFQSVDVVEDITTASFALTNALISDQRNIQLNKAKRARELTKLVGSNLLSIQDIGLAAEMFAKMLRTDAVWVYLLQRNYNFRSGLEQLELKRQHSSRNENSSGSVTNKSSDTSSGSGGTNSNEKIDKKENPPNNTTTTTTTTTTATTTATTNSTTTDNNDDEQTIQMPSAIISAMSRMQSRRRHSLEVKSIVVQCVKTKEVINISDVRQHPSCFHELDMFEKEEHQKHQKHQEQQQQQQQQQQQETEHRANNNDDVVVVSGKISHVHNTEEVPIGLMCVPIFDKEEKEVIGVVELIKRNDEFGNDDVELVSLFALQISSLMRAHQLEKEKKVYIRKVEVLFKVTKMVKQEADLSVVLEKLLSLVCELLESDQAQIFLQDEFHGNQMCEVSSSLSNFGEHEINRPGKAHPAEYSVATHAVEVNEGFLIEDVSNFVNFTLGMGMYMYSIVIFHFFYNL